MGFFKKVGKVAESLPGGQAVTGTLAKFAGATTDPAARGIESAVIGATGSRAKRQAAAARRREQKRQEAEAEKLAEAQQEATDQINDLFETFNDPKATEADLKSKLAKIKKVDIKGFTGRGAGDIAFLRDIAQSTGDSKLTERLLEAQGVEEKIQIEQLQEAGATRAAGAFGQLAQAGGAGIGSRERLLAGQAEQSAIEAQRARRGGALSRLGIRAQGEQQKLDIAGRLPGQEIQAGGLSLAEQAQNQQSLFAQAQAEQGARQFDIAGQQRADIFRTGGLVQNIARGSGQQAQAAGAQQLANIQAQQAQQKRGGLFGFLG